MNPILACPQCGKDVNFHEDEVEGVEDGRTICLSCGLELAEANMILEIVAGQHPQLVEDILEEGGEDEDTDDEQLPDR